HSSPTRRSSDLARYVDVDVEPYAVNRLCLSMRNVRDYDPPKDYHRVATDATDKSWKMLNPMQMRSDFSRQRPIRLFGVFSDSLKMLFPHATTRPLKALDAYLCAVVDL